jgi:hypothetical protein
VADASTAAAAPAASVSVQPPQAPPVTAPPEVAPVVSEAATVTQAATAVAATVAAAVQAQSPPDPPPIAPPVTAPPDVAPAPAVKKVVATTVSRVRDTLDTTAGGATQKAGHAVGAAATQTAQTAVALTDQVSSLAGSSAAAGAAVEQVSSIVGPVGAPAEPTAAAGSAVEQVTALAGATTGTFTGSVDRLDFAAPGAPDGLVPAVSATDAGRTFDPMNFTEPVGTPQPPLDGPVGSVDPQQPVATTSESSTSGTGSTQVGVAPRQADRTTGPTFRTDANARSAPRPSASSADVPGGGDVASKHGGEQAPVVGSPTSVAQAARPLAAPAALPFISPIARAAPPSSTVAVDVAPVWLRTPAAGSTSSPVGSAPRVRAGEPANGSRGLPLPQLPLLWPIVAGLAAASAGEAGGGAGQGLLAIIVAALCLAALGWRSRLRHVDHPGLKPAFLSLLERPG